MTDFYETKEWKKGHNGEHIVADMLRDNGFYVIPSYDYSGEDGDKAPKLQGPLRSFVIPDLDVAAHGRRRWAEVKTKATPTEHRITKRVEHGIPLRHFRHYEDVAAITGNPVWLFVLEEDSGLVLYGSLRNLAKHKRIYEGHKMSRGGMVFFLRRDFKIFRSLDE